MANDEAEDASWSFQPKILYVKCKKGLSQDKIQESIVHSLKEASENCDSDLPLGDFRIESLAGDDVMQDADIAQVAIGPRYIGVLLRNGLVYRVRCCSKTPRKVKLSSTTTDKVPFLVRSDRSFARRLQEELNGRRSGRHRRLHMDLDEMPSGSRRSFLGRRYRHHDFDSFSTGFSARNEARGTNGMSDGVLSSPQTENANGISAPPLVSGSEGTLGNVRARLPSGELSSNPMPEPTPSSLPTQRSVFDNANERIQRETQSVNNSNGVPTPPSRQTVNTSIHQTARQTLALAQILQHQSEMLRNFVGSQQQTSTSRTLPSSFSRVQYHSPVIRTSAYYYPTTFGRDLLPSRYISGALENRRIAPVFSRRGRSFPAPAFVRQVSIENPVFIQVGGDSSSMKKTSDPNGSRVENKKGKEFDWPVTGDREWLETEMEHEVKFTKIAAMTSAFVLVTKSGQLFEWPYGSPVSDEPDAMETNGLNFFTSSSAAPPKAVPHPLACELGLQDKCVCLLATSGIRASVLTTSGHICTFYDKLVKDCKPEQPPSLIQELSHPALLFPSLVGESIVCLDCDEFYSAVMTSSGDCYWWGLLSGGERRDLEEKLSKIKQDVILSVGDRVKLQKIERGSPGTLVYKLHESLGPCVGQIVEEREGGSAGALSGARIKVEIVASGVEISKINVNGRETGSPGSSQYGSVTPSSAEPAQLPSLVDTWELSEVVFLEDDQACLGVVVGTDGPHVIIDIGHDGPFAKPKFKVFRSSELQRIPAAEASDVQGTSAVLKKEHSIYGRFLQDTPKSIMECCRASCPCPDAPTGVARHTLRSLGYGAISMACTREGVALLVSNAADDKVYYLGPACENRGDCSKCFTCSSEVGSTAGNGQVSVTVDAESVLGRDSALRPREPSANLHAVGRVGSKRKLSTSDEDEDQPRTTADATTLETKTPKSEAAFPRLVCSSSLCGTVLLDANGCFFPRTLSTKLNGFHSLEISPFQCFDIGERKVAFENEDYSVLVVPLVFKRQSLAKAVQSGLADEVHKVLCHLEDMTTSNSGKGGKLKGKKKVAVQHHLHSSPVAVEKETLSFANNVLPEVSAVLSEKVSGNRNILHLCCSNLCVRPDVKDPTVNDVLNAYQTENKKNKEDHDIRILQMLLEHPLFGSEMMDKLKEKDANGFTPFLLSLRCHNFKASLYILDYLKDKECKGVFVDWKAMVYCSSSAGETPLHIVSMKSCAGLGLTGLGNSLIVSNLPANYTPRMLLKLFQSRYPSAYRAAIPPLEDVEKAHSLTAWQKRERKLKGPSVTRTWKSNDSSPASKSSLQVPIVPSSASSMRYGNRMRNGNGQRRESLEGMVTFADLKEMRKALCEMDKHVVSNELGHPDVGLTSVVQHILHVKLAKLNAESNKEERSETEMEINGVLYGVTSTGLGCAPKINQKNKPLEASEETQKVDEDELISKLVRRLLQNSEVSLMTNREEETALGFLVNYSKWIKPSENQKKRFQTYSSTKKNNKNSNSGREKVAKAPESVSTGSSTLSKLTGAAPAGSSSSTLPPFPDVLEQSPDPWNEIMVEFDELKNNFSNLVKSLESFEKVRGNLNSGNESTSASTSNGSQSSDRARVGLDSGNGRKNSEKTDGPSDRGEKEANSSEASRRSSEPSGSALSSMDDLIDFTSDSLAPSTDNLPPVLLQLAKSWPCVAKTILGASIDDKTILETFDPDPNAVTSFAKPRGVSEACDLDFFVQELLSDADEIVLEAVTDTIIGELNKYSFSFGDYVDAASDAGGWDPAKMALRVGQRFLRSVTRQLCFLLSHNGMAFVELPSSASERAAGTSGNASEVKRRARRVLGAFSWLSVYELVEAAEAVVSPFRDGVAKPQRSTGKDFGNVSNPIPVLQNTFPPQYGAPRGRPGIRLSGGDNGGPSDTHPLRTASRVSAENEPSSSHYFSGVRLVDVEEDAPSATRCNGSSKRTPSRLSGMSRRQPSPMPSQNGDSDSDDDEENGDNISDETHMVIENDDGANSSAVTGITHEHPFAWALDGRLTSSIESNTSGRGINFSLPVGNISPPSVHAGNCYLARMFSRLVKEVIDVLNVVDGEDKERKQDSVVLKVDEKDNILEYCENTLERSWLWLINVMDTVEGQLHRGRHFDTKRYLVSLQQNGDSEIANMARSSVNMPGATPEEYLMFLLRSHSNEHKDTLPVMDMLCYEHAVYVLDAFFYVLKGWPRSQQSDNPESGSDSSKKDDPVKASVDQATSNNSAVSDPMSMDDEVLRRFFFPSNPDATFETFAAELKQNLQSSHTYVPSVSWELFDKNNSLMNLEERLRTRDAALPVSYRGLSSRELKLPVMHQWSADEVSERWMISIDVFSRLFLAEGPGGERDSFLAARAGTAGRIARFRRALSQLRENVHADQQQGIFGAYGFSGRIGTVLSLNVRRSHLLEDMLKFLGEMTSFHYTNFRVKFEGEEGSGPGVNRGFFAAVANVLKADEKQPAGTSSLLYEPGKLPEQSGYFSPRPYSRNSLLKQETELLKRRNTMFKSIGRFLGLCLWFNNTIPLNLTRAVIKYILGSDIVWQDLAFFNADLFDGLSRMIIDSVDPTLSEEAFQSTYCCHFEVSIAGETVQLITNGSQVPVTKSQTFQYARLYAQKVMVECVEEEFTAMKEGLHEVIPAELLEPLTTEDVQMLISGGNLDIDINRLKAITSFINSNGCSTDILDRFKKWFWSIVNKMTPIQRQQLLYFATGSAMLPAMPERKDNDQDDISITIDIIRGNPKALPMASTCGQRMSVPLYPSRRILKRKLLQAIQCQTYGLG